KWPPFSCLAELLNAQEADRVLVGFAQSEIERTSQ
ncbi:MAG: hypothetical protein ACI9BK_002238, partial [Acidimicrobiales bacterium]